METYEEPQRVIYYQIPKHDPFEKLPRITPAGEGGQPGAGEIQALLQKIGSYDSGSKNRDRLKAGPAGQQAADDLSARDSTRFAHRHGFETSEHRWRANYVPVAKPQVHLNAKNSRPNQNAPASDQGSCTHNRRFECRDTHKSSGGNRG